AGISQSGAASISADALGVDANGDVVLVLDNATANFAANNGAFRTEFIGSGDVNVAAVTASGAFPGATGIHSSGDVLLVSRNLGDININNVISAGTGKVRLNSSDLVGQSAAITGSELGVRAGG